MHPCKKFLAQSQGSIALFASTVRAQSQNKVTPISTTFRISCVASQSSESSREHHWPHTQVFKYKSERGNERAGN